MGSKRLNSLQNRNRLHELKDAIGSALVCIHCGAPSSKARVDPKDRVCSRCRPNLAEIEAAKERSQREEEAERREVEEAANKAVRINAKNAGAW